MKYFAIAERKSISAIQRRKVPNVVGLLQIFASAFFCFH
jgi:NADH:ubiquinone oxidoreductase subunit H